MKASGSPAQKYSDSETASQPQSQEMEDFRLQICHKPLRTNPYTTYRDETGRWIVIRHSDFRSSS